MSYSPSTESALTFTKEVTERWPDRLTGRPACLECSDYLKTEFNKFSDRTAQESFEVHPGAFLGYMKVNVILYLICIVAIWMQYYQVAMITAALSMIITLAEFMFYKEFLDPFYKKREGRNVYGVIEPEGEVRQQIIVSAHHDSAHIFNFLESNAKWYPVRIISAVLMQILVFVISLGLGLSSLLNWDVQTFSFVGLIILLIGLPAIIQLLFFAQDKGTPGAGDNMICTAVAMEIGKQIAKDKNSNYSLKNTRVIIASWDSEECGLRGARAYVASHRKELLKTKTYNFNLESLFDYNSLTLLTSDLNGLVPLSQSMVNECTLVAEGNGYKIAQRPFPMFAGGTDAAEMAKAGIEATCLAGMSMKSYGDEPAYHTSRDTIDAVDRRAVEAAIEIGLAYIKRKDATL